MMTVKSCIFGVCGASLVDSPEIVAADLYRRIAITARHCVDPNRDRMGVTFVEHPGATTGYDGVRKRVIYTWEMYIFLRMAEAFGSRYMMLRSLFWMIQCVTLSYKFQQSCHFSAKPKITLDLDLVLIKISW